MIAFSLLSYGFVAGCVYLTNAFERRIEKLEWAIFALLWPLMLTLWGVGTLAGMLYDQEEWHHHEM